MASATMMGLRRRAPVNSSPTPSSQSLSTTATTSSGKRSRSENNNSPSHGNLNSMNGGGSRDEPPTKKSRGTSTSGAKSSSACPSSSTAPSSSASAICSASSSSSSTMSTSTDSPSSKSRGTSVSRSATQTKSSSTTTATAPVPSSSTADISNGSMLQPATSWPTTSDVSSYASVTGLGLTGGQTAGLCAGSLGMPTPIPYMSTTMATFVGNATNLGKSSSVSYLDISNMTGGSLAAGGTNSLNSGYAGNSSTAVDTKGGMARSYPGMSSPSVNAGAYGMQKGQVPGATADGTAPPRKFQNDAMFNAYQPWVIKTYGDLAKTKTITIKKYARILRTLRGEEVNSAENSKFRFWVKSKGFHIGQPEGYDAKPADRIIGRHAVTSPGLDPPLYVPTQPPHNKTLNGAEGTVPPGRVYKKVAIVENFFDIIHAVHVDLEGRPGKHAGQKRTYRTITETYAFLPREAVTRFLLGCTECQRRPRTPSPTNLSNQSPSAASSTTLASTTTTLSPSPSGSGTTGLATSSSSVQSSPKPRDANHHTASSSEGKNLHNYRHQKQHKNSVATDKLDKEKDEKYNPLSITNLLKKEPVNVGYLASSDTLPESRRTPESDRASSKSSASSKRKRMLPEGRTPSPQPSQPLPRPWSPGLDPKNTPIDYSLPITTSYLKHQQRLRQAEKSKAASALRESETEPKIASPYVEETESAERERFSPATGLIDTNLGLLATIQHLHCQVMLALNERLRPSMPSPLALPPTSPNVLAGQMMMGTEVSVQTGENHS